MVEDQLDLLPTDQQEDEDDLEAREVDHRAVVTASDWTTQTILSQLEKGNIDLNPSFQRRQAWRATRKSQFIESLILGIPVPQLVLAERKQKRGSYVVIDGKQRLLSLAQFSAEGEFEPFNLQGLNIRRDLNGMNFKDLKEDPRCDEDLTSLENQTIRTVVIRNWKDEDFLYTVFLRLNTGSVQLSPQELRQALHPGPFSKFVDDYSIESRKLQNLLGLDGPDFRMRDAELVLRYFAFAGFLRDYTGNLKPLLDKATEELNEIMKVDEDYIYDQVTGFERAIDTASAIFGEKQAFRKWTANRYERAFNRAIFDALALTFSDEEVAEVAVNRKDEVEGLFKDMCENDVQFRTSIEGTTKSVEAIFMRLHLWPHRLAELLRIRVRGAVPGARGGVWVDWIEPD